MTIAEGVHKASVLLADDYPNSFSQFIGQEQAKAELQTLARAAKKRGVRMPHTMLADGRPGVGKTTLALLVAKMMGTHVQVISGKVTDYELHMALAEMRDRDVLVMEEIHQMGKASECLLHYLENGSIVGPMGVEPQSDVTVIGTTTEAGVLPKPVLDRFESRPELVEYSEDDGARIALLHAKKMFGEEGLPLPNGENCRAIARAASCNPRLIRGVLKTVRDIAIAEDGANYDGRRYDLSKALLWKGLTHDGLTSTARRYLLAMLKTFGGRPVGVNALQDVLHEPGGLNHTETLLMEKGYIGKGSQGRFLTPAGRARARELAAEQ